MAADRSSIRKAHHYYHAPSPVAIAAFSQHPSRPRKRTAKVPLRPPYSSSQAYRLPLPPPSHAFESQPSHFLPVPHESSSIISSSGHHHFPTISHHPSLSSFDSALPPSFIPRSGTETAPALHPKTNLDVAAGGFGTMTQSALPSSPPLSNSITSNSPSSVHVPAYQTTTTATAVATTLTSTAKIKILVHQQHVVVPDHAHDTTNVQRHHSHSHVVLNGGITSSSSSPPSSSASASAAAQDALTCITTTATSSFDTDTSFLLSDSDTSYSDLASRALPSTSLSGSSSSGPGSIASSTTSSGLSSRGSSSFVHIARGAGSIVVEDLNEGNATASATTAGGGYVMVNPIRTYSDQSLRSVSKGGDGRNIEFSENEWVDGAGYRSTRDFWMASGMEVTVEEEMEVQGEERSTMPHDPELMLHQLGSNEPRRVDNPYQYRQAQASSYQTSLFQDPNNPYAYQTINQNIYIQASGPPKVSSDGPWSPVAPQVPVYDSGYVAFLPSPGPAGDQDSETSRSRGSSTAHSPQPGKSSSRGKKASQNGKEKDVNAWEHTVVSKSGLQFVSENVKDEVDMRKGIRIGKLDPEVAEKARRIRRMKACWNCWIQKVPCSEEKTCERCTKLFSPIADQLCCRSGFRDYETTFFPDFLHAHFKKKKIEDLISENTSGFDNTVLVVDVSTGELFKPMTLTANVFKPKTRELLRHASLVSQPGQDSQLVERYSAPIGILGLSQSEMKKLCTEHIDEMIVNPGYAAQATAGDDTQLPYEILEIVRKYCAKQDVPLVQNALRLHAIHYFMSTLITFSSASGEKVSRSIGNYDALREPYLSSRLLNRQVKYVMHKLHREITIDVLDGLERSLRARTKDSWGPSFCTILILCLCIEDLQIATDTMVVCDMLKKGTESGFTRDQSYRVCVALDEYPFLQCKRLFHDIYKSHKEVTNGAREGGFNPFRSVHDKVATGMDSSTEAMVRAVFGVVECSYDEILELSKRVATIEFGYMVKPKDIKTNNTGRLASDFLRSFFPES